MILDRLSPDEMAEVSIVFEEGIRLGFNLLQKIYDLRTGNRTKGEVQQSLVEYARNTPLVFRGNTLDMAYYWDHKELPLQTLNELPEGLRENVFRCFSALQEQGLVNFDGTVITVTDAGRRYIHETSFISSVVKADEELNRQIQESMKESSGEKRFKPTEKSAKTANASPQTVSATKGASPAAGATQSSVAQTAKTGAQAVEAGAKAAETVAGAATTAGITLAAQVAQEAVLAANKSINNLMTHK